MKHFIWRKLGSSCLLGALLICIGQTPKVLLNDALNWHITIIFNRIIVVEDELAEKSVALLIIIFVPGRG